MESGGHEDDDDDDDGGEATYADGEKLEEENGGCDGELGKRSDKASDDGQGPGRR